MSGPPPAKPASTNSGVSPGSTPELREVEILDCENQLVRKVARELADTIVTKGLGDWRTATNGRKHVKLRTIGAPGRRPDAWLRPAVVVRERLQRNAPGRELTTMYRFADS